MTEEEKILESKNVTELKALAKKLNLKGYSKLKKQPLIKFILKGSNTKTLRSYIKPNKRKIKARYLWSIFLIIAAVVGFYVDVSSLFSVNPSSKEADFNPIAIDSFKTNILILPFNPDRNCTFLETNYEKVFLERFKNIRDTFNIDLEPIYVDTEQCPQTDNEASKIGEMYNADIVLWGHFDETCKDTNKVRIRYTITNELLKNSYAFKGDTGFRPLNGINDLREGYLQKEVDYIIFHSIALGEFHKGNYRKTLRLLTNINVDRCNEHFMSLMGATYLKLERFEKAFQISNTIIDTCNLRNSSSLLLKAEIIFFNRINSSFNKENIDTAINYFTLAIELDSSINSAYNNRGCLYEELSMNEQALKDYSKAIKLTPKEPIYLLNRANLFSKTNKNNLALRDINEILQINKKFIAAYKVRASINVRMGKVYEALDDINFAISSNDKDSESYSVRAFIHYNMLNFDLALQDCEKSITINPMSQQAYNVKGIILFAQGKIEQSAQEFTKAIDIAPYRTRVYLNRIKSYISLGKFDLAKTDLDKVLQLESNNQEAQKLMFEVETKLEKLE